VATFPAAPEDDDLLSVFYEATRVAYTSTFEAFQEYASGTPIVDNFSPVDGATIVPDDIIGFDCTSDGSPVVSALTTVFVTWDDGTSELIYAVGAYVAGWTAETGDGTIVDGRRFRFTRDAGWRSDFTVTVMAINAGGESVTDTTYNLVVDPAIGAAELNNDIPADGSIILAVDQVTFDVVNTYVAIAGVQVLARYPAESGLDELIYDPIIGFGPQYIGSSSVDDSDPNLWSFIIGRDDGWPVATTHVRVVAWDAEGRQMDETLAYIIDDPTGIAGTSDSTLPVITNVAPTPGTPISRTAMVMFDVTDETELRRVILVAKFAAEWEVIYDGETFSPEYAAGSQVTVLVVGQSYRFRVRRAAGWPEAPSITAYAYDTGGNEPA
jgi:hypothetical protein